MSIIYDALKKTQGKQGNGLLKDMGRIGLFKPGQKLGLSIFHKPFLFFLLLAAALGFSGYYLLPHLKQRSSPPIIRNQEYTQPIEPVIPIVSLRAEPELPNLTLNGIVVTESGNGALINDKILTVNDLIEGARVLEINSKDVLLDYNGKKISLEMK